MNDNKIILYDCLDIYKILNELNDILKLDLIFIANEKNLNLYTKNSESYLIIHKQEKLKVTNQIYLDSTPIKLDNLVEKINLFTLKSSFIEKSNMKIGKYILNTNSREIFFDEKKTKLTEQEIKILLYLEKLKKPIKVDQLQKDIWKYSNDLETHTVETHIHRLRKKFINTFEDDNLILSTKYGYLIE